MGLPGWECSVLLTYLFWALGGAASFLDSLPPPENLSLSRVPNTPCVSVRWRKPSGLGTNCQVNYTLAVYYEKCPPRQNASKKMKKEELSFEDCNFKEDELCVSITTNPKNCESKLASKEVYKYLSPPPAIVKNFSCVYYARTKMNCTWTVVRNSLDISLLYREEGKNNGTLKPCRFYLFDGPMKTGCHLDDEVLKLEAKVYFVINKTTENHVISNNSFIIELRSVVKPPKPKVSIRQEDEHLHFEISTPDYLQPQCWKYKYMYIKCSETTKELPVNEQNLTSVDYDAACKYTVRGKVIYSQYCGGDQDVESDLSEPEYYGEDGDPNLAFKVAMIVTPLIVCCCLIAAIVLFRRNKDIILPKIPEPSLFFKDMLNSTTDGLSKNLGGGKLYVPVKEIVASGVSLEPKSILLHPNHDTCI